ncbi:MAG: hypothetical protein ABI882_12590 [Acidobacteriota bacterium]
MLESEPDEFYVGYEPQPAPGIGSLVRRLAWLLLLVLALVGVFLVVGQKRLPAAVFEYGQQREFEGVIRERPFPTLNVERPGIAANTQSRYALVAVGKHGAQTQLTGLEGRRVKLRGTLIYRDGLSMIEIADGTLEVIPEEGLKVPVNRDFLGVQTLSGEIVDSKCYLGVMNPGSRTTHRECAIRCISGGVPALFVVENANGERSALWLTTVEGVAVGREILDLVAKPVEITGEVTREADQLYLRADPRTYRVLAANSPAAAR